MNPRVIAIIPAFHRPVLLARALEALRSQGPALARVIVVNNSRDAATRETVRRSPVPASLCEPDCNLGVAGGISVGLRRFLDDAAATHVWILDDDVIARPGVLPALLDACARGRAEAAAPVAIDAAGLIRWFPGPFSGYAWDLVRSAPPADEFAAAVGAKLPPWNWASWAGLLVSRRAVEWAGEPRLDLWFSFTDFEYTLRLSSRFRCVLAPTAVIEHAQPAKPDAVNNAQIYWSLRNGLFVSFRLRHGWRYLRHTPGNFFRYLKHHRWRARAWWEIVEALVGGAVFARLEGPGRARQDYEDARAALAERRGRTVVPPS